MRHERGSDLHRRNLDQQDEYVRQHKQESLAEVSAVRQQLQAASAGGSSLEELARRAAPEARLRQLLGECGMAQEMLEHSWSLRRSAGCPVNDKVTGEIPMLQPTYDEARVGRLAVELGAACWQGGKEMQEDRYLLNMALKSSDGHPVVGFCVLDGHSGSRCVDHLVARLPVQIQARLSTKPNLTEASVSKAVEEACGLVDEEFLVQARQLEWMDGSTMVLGLLFPDTSPRRPPGSCKLLVANVGDSRAVLCRSSRAPARTPAAAEGEGELEALRLSEDHKPNRPDEQQRIRAMGGIVGHHGVWRVFVPSAVTFSGRTIPRWGLAVSRAFGDLLLKEPERYGCPSVAPGGLVIVQPEFRCMDVEPASDRFLIVACDGIWDILSDEDAAAVCASQAGVELAAHSLVRHAFAAGSGDNLTALVVAWRLAE